MRARDFVKRKTDLADAAADDVFEVRLADGDVSAGTFDWEIVVKDAGGEWQSKRGTGWWNCGRKGAVVLGNLGVTEDDTQLSAGTLPAATWAFDVTSGTKLVASVNVNTSLTPTRMYIDLKFSQRSAIDVVIV